MTGESRAASGDYTTDTIARGRTASAILTALAFVAALLAIALVLATWLIPQSRDRAARAALRDYAEYFGATVVGNVQWDLVRALHDRLFVPSRSALFHRGDSLPSLAAWDAASRLADSCGCVPPTNEVAEFLYDDSSAALTANAAIPGLLAAWLADTLRTLPRRYTAPDFLIGTPLTAAIAFPGEIGRAHV